MTSVPPPDSNQTKVMLLVWWILWASILASLVILHLFLGRGPEKPSPAGDILVNLAGLVPLFVSIVIRWLVLPRFDSLPRAFPVYVAGLALAEACGILGLFLGGAYRDDLVVLGLLGVAQFVPLFAHRLGRDAGRGQFIPNN